MKSYPRSWRTLHTNVIYSFPRKYTVVFARSTFLQKHIIRRKIYTFLTFLYQHIHTRAEDTLFVRFIETILFPLPLLSLPQHNASLERFLSTSQHHRIFQIFPPLSVGFMPDIISLSRYLSPILADYSKHV